MRIMLSFLLYALFLFLFMMKQILTISQPWASHTRYCHPAKSTMAATASSQFIPKAPPRRRLAASALHWPRFFSYNVWALVMQFSCVLDLCSRVYCMYRHKTWEKAMREMASTTVRISVGDCHRGVEDSVFDVWGVRVCRALANWKSPRSSRSHSRCKCLIFHRLYLHVQWVVMKEFAISALHLGIRDRDCKMCLEQVRVCNDNDMNVHQKNVIKMASWLQVRIHCATEAAWTIAASALLRDQACLLEELPLQHSCFRPRNSSLKTSTTTTRSHANPCACLAVPKDSRAGCPTVPPSNSFTISSCRHLESRKLPPTSPWERSRA